MRLLFIKESKSMAVELKIIWEGDVPGLADKRLSIAAFGDSLKALLVAYKRIASNMISSAVEYAEKGRLQEYARWLDIEITDLAKGSAGIQAVCTARTAPSETAPLFMADITRRASTELLDCVNEESHGHPRNSTVRKYLEALPHGLRRQIYELSENGNAIHEPVIIEAIELASEVPTLSLPFLTELAGDMIGVGFEPGKNEVRIKTTTANVLQASTSQVDAAIELRGEPVRALAVVSKQSRLLMLSAQNAPPFKPNADQIEYYVFGAWDGLLRKLAE